MIPAMIDKINKESLKADVPELDIGATVRVHVMVREGGKERVQVFSGTIIARDGNGATETFTVRRISHGVGVERVFPVHSPHVTKVEVERKGMVRRAKLYYLRGLSGKKSRLRDKKTKR
jgi:large subunit ribosomal protein L19